MKYRVVYNKKSLYPFRIEKLTQGFLWTRWVDCDGTISEPAARSIIRGYKYGDEMDGKVVYSDA